MCGRLAVRVDPLVEVRTIEKDERTGRRGDREGVDLVFRPGELEVTDVAVRTGLVGPEGGESEGEGKGKQGR